MKTTTWCFVIIGILALAAWVAIFLTTVQYLILFAIARLWLRVLVLSILAYFEMLIANYFIFDYHGE